MSTWISLFLLAFSSLFSDIAFVDHTWSESLPSWANSSKYPLDGKGLNGWEYVNFNLMKRGEKFFFTNLQDSDLARLQDPSTSVIVLNNIPLWARSDWRKFLAKISAKKVLICWEPPVILPHMYSKKILNLFDVVFTWNPDLVDNKKFFQFYYPELGAISQGGASFEERVLLTQISGNKSSTEPNELYSLRRKAIRYFEKHHRKDFRFYGQGWKTGKFCTYGGAVSDKIATLQQYRFSLCFENSKNIKGYVTEKIFDCFKARCVPIYFGASDIEELIPQACYIKWSDFNSFSALYKYLKHMPQEEYQKYLEASQNFISSKRGYCFTEAFFGKVVGEAIQKARLLGESNQSGNGLGKKVRYEVND